MWDVDFVWCRLLCVCDVDFCACVMSTFVRVCVRRRLLCMWDVDFCACEMSNFVHVRCWFLCMWDVECMWDVDVFCACEMSTFVWGDVEFCAWEMLSTFVHVRSRLVWMCIVVLCLVVCVVVYRGVRVCVLSWSWSCLEVVVIVSCGGRACVLWCAQRLVFVVSVTSSHWVSPFAILECFAINACTYTFNVLQCTCACALHLFWWWLSVCLWVFCVHTCDVENYVLLLAHYCGFFDVILSVYWIDRCFGMSNCRDDRARNASIAVMVVVDAMRSIDPSFNRIQNKFWQSMRRGLHSRTMMGSRWIPRSARKQNEQQALTKNKSNLEGTQKDVDAALAFRQAQSIMGLCQHKWGNWFFQEAFNFLNGYFKLIFFLFAIAWFSGLLQISCRLLSGNRQQVCVAK